MRLAAGLLVCFAALGITACGGGGADTTSTSTLATTPPGAAPGGSSGGGTPSSPAGPKQGSDQAAPEGGGGQKGAAGFRRPGADNSIPDYGTEADAGVRSAATAALNGYLAARSGGQWGKSCSYLGAAIDRQVAAFVKASNGQDPNCVALLKTVSEQAPQESPGSLGGGLAAFRVKDGKGFALFYGPHRQQYMIPMVREGGSWKVNQLDPVTYPPGSRPAR